jgi:nicotinamide mononucleotide adenylyltransferase
MVSDLGFTAIVSAQLPIKEIRDEYLNENDVIVEIVNSGPNPKDEKGYNVNFSADYSDKYTTIDFVDRNINYIYNTVFKRVLVIARFQGLHLGHKLVLESAKRLSPNITIALRVDDDDKLDLDKNIKLLQNLGYHVIKSPNIDEENEVWEKFVSDFDIVVQGNPVVIEKFQKAVDDNKVKLHFIPRVGHISETKIREAIKEGNLDFAKKYVANSEVIDFLKEQL